jgi:hypothetical protein
MERLSQRRKPLRQNREPPLLRKGRLSFDEKPLPVDGARLLMNRKTFFL